MPFINLNNIKLHYTKSGKGRDLIFLHGGFLDINANKELCFPIKKIWSGCEFTMHAEDHVDIREFGNFGCYKMTGWSLPKVVVDELVNWHEKNKSKKANGQVKIEEQT